MRKFFGNFPVAEVSITYHESDLTITALFSDLLDQVAVEVSMGKNCDLTLTKPVDGHGWPEIVRIVDTVFGLSNDLCVQLTQDLTENLPLTPATA